MTSVRSQPLLATDPVNTASMADQGWRRRALAFPALILAGVVVLGLLGVNGSSLGIYATEAGRTEAQAGVLAGPSRSIRSDEWLVRTPWVLRQAELSLPRRVASSVGAHDVGVLSDLPTASWELMLRPHTAWYLVFGPERGFSLEWWSFFAVQVLGVYWFLLVVTKRPLIAALCAALLGLSPATQWWWAPGTFTTIGYGSAAAACVLVAQRARSPRGRVLLSIIAGYLTAAFVITLYVPWQIGTALVVGPVALAALLPSLLDPEQRQASLRRLFVVAAVALTVASALVGSFLIAHDDAIAAISSTVYPGGDRVSRGGGTDLAVLFGAPFDYFSSRKPSAVVNGTNQSENSSALVLLLPVGVIALLLAVTGRFRGPLAYLPLLGCMVGGAIMAAWMLLPIPASIGRFAMLTRVAPSRLLLPLGFAGVVALALLAHYGETSGARPPRWIAFAGGGLFAVTQAWAARMYTVDGERVDFALAIAFVVVVSVGFILTCGRRPAIGVGVLAIFALWQASMINPLQRGIDPLVSSPLRKAIDTARVKDKGAGWIAFNGDALVKGTLTASGAKNISAVSPYPDADAWAILDPESDDEEAWNRYAHLSFVPGPPGQPPIFRLAGADNLAVELDPCSPVLDRLGVGFMVTQGVEVVACGRLLARVPHGAGFVAIYERQVPATSRAAGRPQVRVPD